MSETKNPLEGNTATTITKLEMKESNKITNYPKSYDLMAMDRRDLIAALIVAGICSNETPNPSTMMERLRHAVNMADSLIDILDEEPPELPESQYCI